jgi:hypothetical protein
MGILSAEHLSEAHLLCRPLFSPFFLLLVFYTGAQKWANFWKFQKMDFCHFTSEN